jgi:hypothetical protein
MTSTTTQQATQDSVAVSVRDLTKIRSTAEATPRCTPRGIDLDTHKAGPPRSWGRAPRHLGPTAGVGLARAPPAQSGVQARSFPCTRPGGAYKGPPN